MNSKGHLLIIDDEIDLLATIAVVLADVTDKITTASSAKIALKIIKEQKIDCILCDMNMPEMNGLEVLKEIRRLDYNMPFIFYTGYGNEELMQNAIRFGAFDFLEKPSIEVLPSVIKKAMLSCFEENDKKAEQKTIDDFKKLLK
jgi:DNA-binding NtrC family response regulator